MTIIRRSHPILVALAMILIAGCGDKAEVTVTSAPVKPATGKPRVALVMKSLANEFFAAMADGAKQHQAAHAGDYDLVVNGIKDERDLTRQVALVEEMVASGVSAIVIAPADSKALVPALRRAREAGVVVVNIDNRLDADVLTAEKITVPFVGPDNRVGAKKVAEHLAKTLKAGDQVVVLEGIRTSFNGAQRRLGFEDALKAANITIADSQSAQWDMAQANTIASSLLSRFPDAKAILAANDSMALGAIAAVKAAGKAGTVQVVGFDNIPAVRDALKAGIVFATADQHGDQLAVYGIELALKLIADPRTPIADRETPVDLVTAADVK
ncbi:MAG TPA: sugar ABC transporter substrate-binding protein [Planctomycetota bacterium]|nr:sugar ABC transporter substrate-binding protein [Planctomycetota bacterium]